MKARKEATARFTRGHRNLRGPGRDASYCGVRIVLAEEPRGVRRPPGSSRGQISLRRLYEDSDMHVVTWNSHGTLLVCV